MPRLFHKNRSSHSLLSSQDVDDERDRERNTARYQPSPTDSPIHSPVFPPSYPYSDQIHDQADDHELDQNYVRPYQVEEIHARQLGRLKRSSSQRAPGHINTNVPQPTINLVGPAHSTPSSAIEEDAPDTFYRQGHQQQQQQHHHHLFHHQQQQSAKEDKKKRRFFGLGSSSKESPAPTKLGRSTSVRKREQALDAGHFSSQQDWSHASPTDDFDDYGEETAGVQDPNIRTNPPAPDKEPLRSPGFAPSALRQEHHHQGSISASNQPRRSPTDRQAQSDHPGQSHWSRPPTSVHQSAFSESGQSVAPLSATSVAGSLHLAHRSPSDSLHQPWQEQIPSRPSSSQSLEPPLPKQTTRPHESHHARSSSSQASTLSHFTQTSMVHPPPPPPGPNRRPSEAQQEHQATDPNRPGAYQPYAQGVQDRNIVPSNAPIPNSAQLAPQTQVYRNSAVSTMQAGGHEQGRSTPPPSRSRDDLSSMDLNQLQLKHDELQEKYRKVKKYYFDKDAQLQQLQNVLAHQRLSQSRTSLDDNEYANRFQRLDGAINNLAFNLRREWRQVPPWLAPHVNRDACTNPTKEMTAVGRAAISRWLVDELLERYFHPGLEPGLSAQLKIIEKNIRRLAPPTPSDEEKDLLMARISTWRLSTLDGLQEILSSPQATENRTHLTEILIEKLVASLGMMLKEPAPPGVEGGVSMIVELAVGIAANLPVESRDVFVDYVAPGQLVNEAYMKIETGLPALTNPGDGPPDGEPPGITSKPLDDAGSIDSRETESAGNNIGEEKGESPQQQPVGGKKKGMFGSFMGGSNANKKGNASTSGVVATQQASTPLITERREDRVRFSTFMAVHVRGRNVLAKAPVYLRE